jgi:hypothetical protein
MLGTTVACLICRTPTPRGQLPEHVNFDRRCLVPICKACYYRHTRPHRADPKYRLWCDLYARCHGGPGGREFDLEFDDVETPETCAYLGLRLDYRRAGVRGGRPYRADDAASVDRIDNSRGYVRGNVQTISWLANRMKNIASVAQLLEFAEGVLRVHRPSLAALSPDEAEF